MILLYSPALGRPLLELGSRRSPGPYTDWTPGNPQSESDRRHHLK